MRTLIVLLLVGMLNTPTIFAGPGQKVPDRTRTLQIQHALIDHGYVVKLTGKMDAQTLDVLKSIAKENNWQSQHAPDARVLGCVLGLGNPHFDMAVCDEHHNRLERKGDFDESKLEEDRCLHRFGTCTRWPSSSSLSSEQGLLHPTQTRHQ